ncbi:sulfur carrier protein ThiS [Castellaniella sp.]|uniref:sulfur carrier protein ThiS n=1 Tax=Castellaniella sp. TaxID=1955812 RepID=UPI00356AE357
MTLHLNGQRTTLENARTIRDLLAQLGLEDKRIAVERNGEIVPKSSHANTLLAEGDQIEIITAVGGG